MSISTIGATSSSSTGVIPGNNFLLACPVINTYYVMNTTLKAGQYTAGAATNTITAYFYNGTTLVYSGTINASTVFTLSSDVTKVIWIGTSTNTQTMTYNGVISTTTATLGSIQTITSTQSVTFTQPTLVVALGGGGNGGTGNGTWSGGGGGSGYLANGLVSSGTYTATIGAATGATSIGSITANGGGTGGSAGTGGGPGGSGGGGISNSSGTVGGSNGGGGGTYSGTYPGGTGSSVTINGGVYASWNITPGTGGVAGVSGTGAGGGGIYAGGGGGQGGAINGNGQNATGWGGGGGGANGNGGVYGNGYQGVIWYRTVA